MSFPTMKKSDVDYKAELTKFRFEEAQKKIPIPIPPAALKKGKELVAEAKQADLKKPVGKVGIAVGNLVFRIKYEGGNHYGKDDILLIKDYEGAVGTPKLSEKSAKLGQLNASGEKNALTLKWWTDTLGNNPDPVGLGALLQKFVGKYRAVDTAPSRRIFEETQEALRRVAGAAAALKGKFPAENDQRILRKLEMTAKATDIGLAGLKDRYEAKRLQEAQAVVARLRALCDNAHKSIPPALKVIRAALGKNNLVEAHAEIKECLADLQRARDHLDNPGNYRLSGAVDPDDSHPKLFANETAPLKAGLDKLEAALNVVRGDYVQALKKSPAQAEGAAIEKRYDALNDGLRALKKRAEAVADLTAVLGRLTQDNKDWKAWAKDFNTALPKWREQAADLLADVTKLQKEAGPADKHFAEDLSFYHGQVKKMREEVNSQVVPSVTDGIKLMASLPTLAAPIIAAAKKRVLEVREAIDAAKAKLGTPAFQQALRQAKNLHTAVDKLTLANVAGAPPGLDLKSGLLATATELDGKHSYTRDMWLMERELQQLEAQAAADETS